MWQSNMDDIQEALAIINAEKYDQGFSVKALADRIARIRAEARAEAPKEAAEKVPCDWCLNSSYFAPGNHIMKEPCMSCVGHDHWPNFEFSHKRAALVLASARPTNAQKRGEAIDWEAVGIEFDEFARRSFINLPGEHYELKAAQEAGRMMMHLVRRAFRALKPADEPKEEREAEVGDIVTWTNSHGARMIGIFGREITQGNAIVLMRRAEVERRIEESKI